MSALCPLSRPEALFTIHTKQGRLLQSGQQASLAAQVPKGEASNGQLQNLAYGQ